MKRKLPPKSLSAVFIIVATIACGDDKGFDTLSTLAPVSRSEVNISFRAGIVKSNLDLNALDLQTNSYLDAVTAGIALDFTRVQLEESRLILTRAAQTKYNINIPCTSGRMNVALSQQETIGAGISTYRVMFNQCDDGERLTLNGELTMEYTSSTKVTTFHLFSSDITYLSNATLETNCTVDIKGVTSQKGTTVGGIAALSGTFCGFPIENLTPPPGEE